MPQQAVPKRCQTSSPPGPFSSPTLYSPPYVLRSTLRHTTHPLPDRPSLSRQAACEQYPSITIPPYEATSTVAVVLAKMAPTRARTLLLALAATFSVSVSADDLLFSMNNLPETQKKYEMQLQLTAPDSGGVVPLTYGVVPLTAEAGLNQSQTGVNVSGRRGGG